MQYPRIKTLAPEDAKKADLEANSAMAALIDRMKGADAAAREACRLELERNYVFHCMEADELPTLPSLFYKRRDSRLLKLFEAWQRQVGLLATNG